MVFTVSLIVIGATYFFSMLTMLSNPDEERGFGFLNIIPVFNADELNEKGEKARKIYNKSLLALAIWVLAAYFCYKQFNG